MSGYCDPEIDPAFFPFGQFPSIVTRSLQIVQFPGIVTWKLVTQAKYCMGHQSSACSLISRPIKHKPKYGMGHQSSAISSPDT